MDFGLSSVRNIYDPVNGNNGDNLNVAAGHKPI